MADSDESDDHRLTGRTPRPRPGPPDTRPAPAADLDDTTEDESEEQFDAVTRLIGFLRSTD
jgi:hypothetical protein